jgi:hypothetical protein
LNETIQRGQGMANITDSEHNHLVTYNNDCMGTILMFLAFFAALVLLLIDSWIGRGKRDDGEDFKY